LRFSRKTFDTALAEECVYFGKKGDSSLVIKKYLSDIHGGGAEDVVIIFRD